MPSLEDATHDFYDALNAVLGGDAEPMLTLWSHADDVTYMSPFGELLVGWEPVRASWHAQAGQRLGGRVDPAELRHFDSPSLGSVVGFERGSVQIEGTTTPVDIRATSTYRLEDGRWKMIGHHTDPLG
ncbi:MAG: YybH family protein [Solirubrobacteraceae bacterium]